MIPLAFRRIAVTADYVERPNRRSENCLQLFSLNKRYVARIGGEGVSGNVPTREDLASGACECQWLMVASVRRKCKQKCQKSGFLAMLFTVYRNIAMK